MKTEISAARLRELLHYDPETGVFTRRVTRNAIAKAGTVAGTLDRGGYVAIMVDGRRHKAHRLAWLYVYGKWPSGCLDHINRLTGDNRISNLREVTYSENQQNTLLQSNNTSGYRGVVWDKKKRRWKAHIKLNGKRHHLGSFITAEVAHEARKAAEVTLHTHRPIPEIHHKATA